ncbi:hypothetical protein ACFQV8_37500 [Pseudonocardia benzenivorans]
MRASPASSGGRHARRERGVDADDAVEDVESPARGLLRPDADRPAADRHIARPAGPGQGAEAVGPRRTDIRPTDIRRRNPRA